MKTNTLNQAQRSDGGGTIAQAGALFSAILASACCWLPLTLIAFGVSSGAVAAKFEALRLVFLPATFALLGLAFYLTYRKPRAVAAVTSMNDETCRTAPANAEGEASCCPPIETKGSVLKKWNKIMLWAVAAFVLAFALFPNYVGLLLSGGDVVSAPLESHDAANQVKWALTIDGMTCEGCAQGLKAAFVNMQGVTSASVDYKKGHASIAAESSVSEDNLRTLISEVGYTLKSATPS